MASSTRTSLLLAAERLYYAGGITATGVDSVARSAGVTKPTLYAHFGSKAELVAAVLQRRHEERRAELEGWLDPVPVAERPLAVFDWLTHFYTDRGERGCGFLNAAAELTDQDVAARAVVRVEKEWLLHLLTAVCAAAGCHDAELLGSQLSLLIDGVAGRALVAGPAAARTAAVAARQAAAVLVEVDR